MVYNKYIGIIGGTGTIGSIIVKYLLQLQTHFHVLIGGRRSIKEISMSTFYNSERLKYNQMNYNNDVELDNFCSQCLLVINAVGPSFKINDKIALHALRNNCHYIDIGGYGILRDLLKPYEKSIEAQKLCFIIGVGWMPGISGVFSKTTGACRTRFPYHRFRSVVHGGERRCAPQRGFARHQYGRFQRSGRFSRQRRPCGSGTYRDPRYMRLGWFCHQRCR